MKTRDEVIVMLTNLDIQAARAYNKAVITLKGFGMYSGADHARRVRDSYMRAARARLA